MRAGVARIGQPTVNLRLSQEKSQHNMKPDFATALIISEAKDSSVLGEKKRELRGGMYKIGA